MFDTSENRRKAERALIIGAHFGRQDPAEASSLLDELDELVNTLGIPRIGRMLIKCPEPHPRYLLGSGKADEIREWCEANQADVVIFDNPLSPAQQRNWEKLMDNKVAVIDREEVILDIFGEHARTKESRLQVDLARMEYSLPRLTRAWTHLSRQGGAGGGGSPGSKGEGETQLELDRRIVAHRITKIKEDLAVIRRQRATRRKERQREDVPHAAIVGYTNAGKSSLLRRLTGADVLVADQLFATLDTTTRKTHLPDGQTLLLTDTVGFVRKLPHRLVESFKSTLEEAILTDFLLHVVDASDPEAIQFHRTTLDVLLELGAEQKTIITLLNKADRIEDNAQRHALRLHFPDALFISTHTGEGIDLLLERLADYLRDRVRRIELLLPPERGDLLPMLHREGQVISSHTRDDGVLHVHALIPRRLEPRLAEWRIGGDLPDPVPAS